MVLQRQIVDVPVGAGVDELTGTQQLNPGKWVLAENCRIVDTRTIEQRPGYAAMTTSLLGGGSITTARALMRCGDETLIDDGLGLYTYVRDDDTWRAVDRVCEVSIDGRIPGERGAPAVHCTCDATWQSGMYVHAWSGPPAGASTQRLYARITDELTGARLAPQDWTCNIGTQVRCVAVPGSTRVYVFYTNNSGAGARQLVCRWVDINTPGTWSAEIVITVLAANTPWDVQAMLSDRFIVAHTPVAGMCTAAEISLAGAVLDFAGATFAGTSVCSVSYDANADRVYMTYCAAAPNGLRAASYTRVAGLALAWDVQADADVYSAGVPMTRCCGQTNVTAVGARVVYSIVADTTRAAQTRSLTVNNAGVIVADTPTYHVQALGVPRWTGSRLFVVAYVAGDTAIGVATLNRVQPGQHATYLVEIIQGGGPARPVARIAWGQSSIGLGQSMAIGLNVCSVGYVTAVLMLSENLTHAAAPGEQVEGFDLYVLDITPGPNSGVEQDGELVMSGPTPMVYDGDRVSEYGFHYYPTMFVEQSVVAGGPPIGTYGYAVCYVHRDARGVLHRSTPVTSNFLTNGANKVTIYASQYCLTCMQDTADASYPAQIELYRTVVGGSVFYHVETADVVTTNHTHTFTDNNVITDALLVARRMLYTTGDVLENVAPPAFRYVLAHNNRLWGISCDDVDRIWLSKLQSLRDAQGFNEVLTYRVPGADLVALGSLDNKLIAFGKRGIWSIFGSGPNDLNQGNDLSEPNPISAEHGCIDARSVCTFPGGCTFQGLDGLLYVVNPGMQVQCISLPVYDTLHSFPTINSVVYVPDDHELRVLATNTASTNSVVLVWNTLHDQWHVWKLKDGGGNGAPASVGAVLMSWSGSPDRYGVLLTSGVALRESGYTDPDTTYPTVSLKTGPLALASISNYQRLWDIGLNFEKLLPASNSSVTLYAYKDLVGASTWSTTWTAADAGNAQSGARLQLLAHVPIAHQKCESVAVAIMWTPAGGLNLRLQGLSLRIGAKAGRPRILPAAARK